MDLSKYFLENNLIHHSKVKGCLVKSREILGHYGRLDEMIRNMFRIEGFFEFSFPILGGVKGLDKKFKFFKDFRNQIYFLEGNETYLRPTSESIIYEFIKDKRRFDNRFSRIFQFGNVFRKETNQTRPFFRMREFHFFEAHTTTSREESLKILEIYEKIVENFLGNFGIKYRLNERPEWDRFPGAKSTIVSEILWRGELIQGISFHDYWF